MKVLLLGPRGQLGSDVLKAVSNRSTRFEVVSLGRECLDVVNATEAAAIIAAQDFDAAINCTSYHLTDQVESNAQQAMAVNAFFPRALAKLCAEKGARVVHISTDYVFGGQAKRTPLQEDDARAPVNVYGASKALGEDLMLRQGGHSIILRVASLFGVAGASGKGGNFVETMIRLGRERGKVRVVKDQIMSPTATADISEAILDLLEAEAPAGVYHCVNRGGVSWAQFTEQIFARAGIAASVEHIPSSEYPTPAERPPYSVLDPAKLERAIGRPMPVWQDALDRYLLAKGHRSS